ncbi:hypothetical protein BFW38_10665 [Terasakiispira papahanaumokuakeensis]|uniref:HTH lysR-type domain-containing protein n=1 Tax=Terasakiispira papahanaumokuakeensis TaxID=197479 RepID=A0A1E2VAP8_9GAMM|nr:LysR family transcriptional regulator [Terasakiispira papahanaumokuakeensis]ODC03932.1 hypothetical protein BFW38_10665 [Terasakiispira papahanaumokuakeensis]
MERFDAYQAFCQVMELGSFAGAARALDLSTAMVSKHVAALEKHLGVRLLTRTTRRLTPTDEGRLLYQQASALLNEWQQLETEVSARAGHLMGKLRISAPMDYGVASLMPSVAEFQQLHPQLKIQLMLEDRRVDLTAESVDLAVRIGLLQDSSLVARTLGESQLSVYASPEYLEREGRPETPADLRRHRCLHFTYTQEGQLWRFRDPSDGSELREHYVSALDCNNGRALCEAAAAGLGVVQQPDFMMSPYLESGRLVPILEEWMPPPLGIYLVYAHRHHLPARVQAFIEFLCARVHP